MTLLCHSVTTSEVPVPVLQMLGCYDILNGSVFCR